jgi:light-regulated signal transduction histidine kinase (bacteriophytochrome)
MVLQANEGKLDPVSGGHLKRVVAGSRHMGALIDDLLNLARLSRQEMRRQQFNLSETVGSVAASLAAAQPGRSVAIVIQPDLIANADPGLVRAVLDNLIGNAWKFTGKCNAPKIEFGAIVKDGRNAFFVRDNGAGFDMQYAHKLFAPFQRLHHAEEFDGTGIGLATVKKIVQRHGGRVWIDSAVSAGTTVYFTLG